MATYEDISGDLEVLEFIPHDSRFLSVCIDKQTGSYKKGERQDDRMVKSGMKIEYALFDQKLVKSHILRYATRKKNACSYKDIKEAFKEEAKNVGEEGIFFFHFSGHGITRSGHGLAPADYDEADKKCITATTLTKWLHKSKCKAKFVVFILDCCYSGGVAKALTSRGSSKVTPFEGLQVMTSCEACETSFIVDALGCSVFSYFLSYAISTVSSHPEEDLTISKHYPIKAIHEKCYKLSNALSSLFLAGDLVSKAIHPELRANPSSSQLIKEQRYTLPSEGEKADLDRIIQYLKKENLPEKHPQCQKWLDSRPMEELQQLATEGPAEWEPCLVRAVLCGMLRSIAIVQQTHAPGTAATVDMYLIFYVDVVKAILHHQQNPNHCKQECIDCLEFYKSGLKARGVDKQHMEPLNELEETLETIASD